MPIPKSPVPIKPVTFNIYAQQAVKLDEIVQALKANAESIEEAEKISKSAILRQIIQTFLDTHK